MLKEKNVFVTLEEFEKQQMEGGGIVGLTGGLAMNLPGFNGGSTNTNNSVSDGSESADYIIHLRLHCNENYDCVMGKPEWCPYH